MTPKQKAEQLLERFKRMPLDMLYYEYGESFVSTGQITHNSARVCAIILVYEVLDTLTKYGEESMELQNMDSELRYWHAVLDELKNLKSL